MQNDYSKFTDLNAEILAISVEDLSRPDLAARAQGYPFPVLYDPDTEVARTYGTYNQGAGYSNPYVFVIDSNGSVVWEHKGSVYNRTPNSAIIAELEKLG